MPIFWLTFRQLIGAKRTMLLASAALLPVLLALVFRSGGDQEPAHWTAQTLLAQFVVGTMLPLAALVFGTAALGSEIDDGTAVYLLSKPIPRAAILLPKLAAAVLLTAGFVLVATIVSGAIAAWGSTDGAAVLVGFSVAVVTGAVVYCALFMLLSVMTTRAFIAGLIYVFIWEGVVTRLFTGTRIFSVRQYTLGVADGVASVGNDVFKSDLSAASAVLMMVLVGVGATLLAIRRLRRFEIGETA
ncbi:MAG: ABC transporter permease [Chloroflexi bacterium]|nr:ABC transporter permease [Chloroflexota bacterium]